jgi:hypothetical protein
MNQINASLLAAPMLPQQQVLGSSSEHEIDWFKHIPEYHSIHWRSLVQAKLGHGPPSPGADFFLPMPYKAHY